MQTESTSDKLTINLPKLPWLGLFAAIGFGVIAGTICVFININFNQEQLKTTQRHLISKAAIDNVQHYDEELTSLARLYAATSDPAYENQYNEKVPKLESAISQAKSAGESKQTALFAQSTDASNAKLIELEIEAFSLAKAGKKAEAIELLKSKIYTNEKVTYANASKIFFQSIKDRLATENKLLKNTGSRLSIITKVSLIIFAGLFIFFATSLASWNRRAIAILEKFKSEVAERQAGDAKILEDQLLLAKSRDADVARSKHMTHICAQFEASVQDMLQSMSLDGKNMIQKASDMKSEGAQAAQQAAMAASKVSNTKSAVENMAAATEEMTASISEINQLVIESKHIAQGATTQVGSANKKMGSLTQAASRIGEISRLITDITSRTNLLALNATIEAARAGEAGRGFAVVANEVKNLAQQTVSATDEIGALIVELQNATQDSIEVVKQISVTISDIDMRVSTVAAAVQQQNNAAIDMATNAQSAQNYVQEFEQFVRSTNSSASNSNELSDNLGVIVQSVAIQFDDLQIKVNHFLADVQAA
jgi:methyl-accepting chemotaxis protein